MIIFIYGPDTFRSRIYLNKMMDKFKADRDPSGYNTVVLDCLIPDEAQRAMSEVLAAPFLAERRMIVLKRLLNSKEKDVRSAMLERVEQKKMPDSNVVIFWEDADTFKTKDAKLFFDILQKEHYKECFVALEGRELTMWIQQEIKNRHGVMDKDALAYFTVNCGSDMWRVSHVIDQLIAHAGERAITKEDVTEFIHEIVDNNIFNLIDAAVTGQKKKAFHMMAEQYRIGEDDAYVFAMLVRQFRILLQIKDALERAVTPDARAMGLHPFVLKKTLPMAKRYSMDQLKQAHETLLAIDIQTKTGQSDRSVLLDVFVGSM